MYRHGTIVKQTPITSEYHNQASLYILLVID